MKQENRRHRGRRFGVMNGTTRENFEGQVMGVAFGSKLDFWQAKTTIRNEQAVGANSSRRRCTSLITTVSVISLFKSPMILIGIFSLAMVIGMPYLMENCKFAVIQLPGY
jgi:hypothetical protein